MKKILFFLLPLVSLKAAAQNDKGFKAGGEGLEYKIISDGKGMLIRPGQYADFDVKAVISRASGDSVVNDTRETGAPQIIPLDTMALPKVYYSIFSELRKGDSLVTRIMTDSLGKSYPQTLPAFMKPGDYIVTEIRINDIYPDKATADAAGKTKMLGMLQKQRDKSILQMKKDDRALQNYFAKHHIKVVKTKKGAYVEMLQQGSGKIDTSKFVTVNYTGKKLDGKIFDSNTDPAMGHVTPLLVNLTNQSSLGNTVIPGMADALLTMQKGARANIYLPSPLGYGPVSPGGDIGPDEILIFEVKILAVLTKKQAAVIQAEQNKPQPDREVITTEKKD